MSLLEVRDVSLAFGGVKALTDVSIDVQPGTVTAVIGPNGAGKTSLYNVISGFYRPQKGSVFFDGGDVTTVKPHQRAGLGLARTFQNIALFRGLTVLENIKLGAHHRLRTGLLSAVWYLGRAAREESELRREIEERIIDLLHLADWRDAPVSALSYGLQKRVELARALAMRPRLLMLDEPVAGMNREEKDDMSRYILDVREQWDVTVLLIEHDIGMVMDLSDRIHVLNFGCRLASGSPQEVAADPAVIEAYIGEHR
jgi:branched-chain amino acid transport system ATP-binding protein